MKKLLCLLLALVMLLSVCACAKTQTPATETPEAAAPSAETPAETPEVQPVVPADDALEEITLPLCEEKKELTVWLLWSNEKVTDPNTLETAKYVEELTNVHIKWITVSAAEAAEKYQLMLASSELPDIIIPFSQSENPDVAIADGWALDMADLIAKYMPNYRKYLAEHPVEASLLSGQDGVVRTFAGIPCDDNGYRGELQWCGLCVRSDLIEKAGYDGPLETIEDYHNMLLTCKENLDGLTAPLYVSGTGYGATGAFMSAYGVASTVMNLDGKVVFGPAQDGYGQWLEEMRKWYSEGLIDPNFDTVSGLDPYFAPASVVGTNQTVCFTTLYNCIGTLMPMIMGNVADPTAVITPVMNPVLKSGDTPTISTIGTGSMGIAATSNYYITTDCDEPELAAQWLDFLVSEQGMAAANYGKEGVTYELDTAEDAKYRYVLKEGYNTEEDYTTKTSYMGIGAYNWDTKAQISDAQMAALSAMYAAQGIVLPDTYQMLVDAKEMWDSQAQMDLCNFAKLTDEETAAIATINTDITTRVAEYTVQYIKGLTDKTFDEFRAELESMQLQVLIDTYQTALDRYLSK